jgi:Chaperone of endosialidase
MKTPKLLMLLLATIFQFSLWAQTPQKFSYQAVVKNASNNLVTNHAVGLKLSILNASSTVVYAETQTPVTNANGLISVEVGSGTVETGTMAGIDWSTSTYSLKSEIDPTGGTSYSITGTSSLLSVPYALHAKTVDNAFSGSYTDLTNKPTLATVAGTGSYTDLTNKPSIPSGTVTSVTGTSPISVATGTSTPAISLGTVPVANGGTGATNLTGYVKGAGTSTLTAAATIPAADISGNITGNATNVSGTVAVSNGGTGTTTAPTQYGVIYASSTSAYASTTAGTSGYLLQSNGTSAPSWLPTVPVTNGGTGATTLTGVLKGNDTSAITVMTGTTGYNTYWSDANTLSSEQYLASSRGGLGASMTAGAAYAIPYATSTTAYGTLAGNITTTKKFLTQTGNGTVSAAPAWGTIASTDISGTMAVANGGTGATTLTGYVKGTGTTAMTASATIPAADISGNITGNATNVSGTVAVSNGGTGTTTAPTQYGLIYASTTSAYASTAAGTSGYLLQSNGTSAPSWLSTVPVANGGTGTTTGSITGTSALTLAAGGTNQNVNITPSGTGFTVLGGNVGIGGSWNSAFKLSIGDASTTASSATLNISKTGAISGDGYGVSVSISGASSNTYAMRGLASGTGANNISVLGQSQGAATNNYGVYGYSFNGTTQNYGVYGGTSGSTGTNSVAGWFQNTSTPVINKYGIFSEATGANGTNYGGYFTASGATTNYALVTNAGNVGIGTITPGYKLDVYASVNSTYAAQILNNSSAGSGLSVSAGGNPGNGSNKLLSLKDGGSNEKFTVLDNGKVGIGTTTPSYLLTLNGSATTNPTIEIQYGGVTKGYLWYENGSDFIGVGRGSAANSITFKTSQLNYNSAYCNGTTWVDASDARLKRDIQPMTNYGLSTVMQLKPVTYYFKADKTNHHEVGFIAQEMQKIVPEVVSGTEGDLEKGETLGLSYGNLVPVLTKAIQEQQTEITDLKKQLAELKAMLIELKNK